MKKILSIIPARGGSKGLVKKNIALLGDKPLVAWSIEASLKSRYISTTVVTSDDVEILNISKSYGAKTIKRDRSLALDDTPTQDVVKNTLEILKDDNFEYLILLQPTSPLRDEIDIDLAFEKFFNADASALISVYEIDNKILKAFKISDNGFIEGISNNTYPFMPRQDLPKTYMSNGAIYIIKVDSFLKDESFFTDKTISFEMDKKKSVDIDTIDDLNMVRRLICES